MSGRVIERDELDELNRLGVPRYAHLATSRAFRTSEWDYVTEQDLAAARADYVARLERVKRDIVDKRITGATARRALRIAEHAVTVAERQTLTTSYREDDTDFDPLLADVIATRDYVRPSSEQVIIASRNPMGNASWSLALEHAATQFLHAHGVRTTSRPDVWSRRHNTHLAMADRVAYKGAARYALPQPCRYGKLSSEPAETTRDAIRLVDVSDTPEWRPVKVTELLVTPRFVVIDGELVPNNGRVRKAWRGHRSITVRLAETSQRKSATVRASKRAQAVSALKVGKRGPAVDPWNLSPRSLPAAVKRDEQVSLNAERLEQVMRTSAFGASLDMSDGTTITLTDVSLSTAQYRDMAYPVRELARRAALAGLDLD